ncbi:hypothetical protein QBC34DRAFT_305746 [Podospora aff. communis PSN243]|uniref:Suppressor of anucleate metulae protein B n=1 Tax=Podospora aff. communis PSN243 TaxID=3040156 RepID=A0AAV9GC25_9PEZI|nr:hypothetical protein QBC34DRAFT_305746 [Podospora aff. communis PSN243]
MGTKTSTNSTSQTGPKDLPVATAGKPIDNNDNDNDNDSDDDWTPPPREAFHTDPKLCHSILRTVAASAPLRILSSTISMGSGLFLDNKTNTSPLPAGREIYRSVPLMMYINPDLNPNICHYCHSSNTDAFGAPPSMTGTKTETETIKSCSGCGVARFCSKKCQRLAWTRFHKDECKILKEHPKMRGEYLLLHRLVFWQQRGFVTTEQGRVVEGLETHFTEYSKVEERAAEIYDVAEDVVKATGGKVGMGLVWRLLPAMRTNCVGVRMAEKKDVVGAAFDLLTAVINHSCEPNAFVFFEGNELKVRSLREIAPGEEITISYVDKNIDVAARRKLLQHEHFFECRCIRCRNEHKEHVSLLKTSKNIAALHLAQRSLITLMKNAVWAANHPGMNAQFEDLATIEAQLRIHTSNVFTNSEWPGHIAPLPMSRMYLAALYLDQEKLVPALRLALQGKLMSRCKSGPDWVNEMMDLMSVLIVAGNIPPDSPLYQAEGFPTMDDTHAVTYGYLHEVCKEAGTAFGGDSKYTKAICDMFAGLLAKKPDARPGSKEFAVEFEEGQKRVLAWAGVLEEFGITLGR